MREATEAVVGAWPPGSTLVVRRPCRSSLAAYSLMRPDLGVPGRRALGAAVRVQRCRDGDPRGARWGSNARPDDERVLPVQWLSRTAVGSTGAVNSDVWGDPSGAAPKTRGWPGSSWGCHQRRRADSKRAEQRPAASFHQQILAFMMVSGLCPPLSHRRGHWFDPSIAHRGSIRPYYHIPHPRTRSNVASEWDLGRRQSATMRSADLAQSAILSGLHRYLRSVALTWPRRPVGGHQSSSERVSDFPCSGPPRG
jgi:hypothetical protein